VGGTRRWRRRFWFAVALAAVLAIALLRTGGFQYVDEVSAPIEPYRAMPLLPNSNTLNANGLATHTPKFWGNSCLSFEAFEFWDPSFLHPFMVRSSYTVYITPE